MGDTRPILPPFDWKRAALAPIATALLVGGAFTLIDKPISDAAHAFAERSLGGDIKRELEMLQQFGGVMSMVIAGAIIALLDPTRFRRVLDWLLAAGLGAIVFAAIKISTGRPRPSAEFDRPWSGPLAPFDVNRITSARPIEFWHEGVYAQLSMPSTHTTHAAIAAVFLSAMYPPLRWLVWPLVVVVACSRVLFQAHWPSDVIVGGCLGFVLAHIVIDRYWGVRGLDWLWVRFVDRKAMPAFPTSLRLDQDRASGS